ncbi:hypothetical protein INS49_012220 [Diaporthe citri]|uniref:uncharacterized protein n=1 Tax=Diaporthe citri TaxID=83186 RepID=UPI001C7E53B5|nr:uncharacterized protein INS49_012220 [Diaporthe citri]KAG6358702.1 hypothetical protein INS49_012220 [Diaporthe citri]
MLMEWSYLAKHQDEEKPPLPYRTGATFPARTWDPPLEGLPDGHAWDEGELDQELQNEHPLETCVRYTGATLSKINACEWSRAERKAIMKAILDGDSKMRQAGGLQRDLVPRNVILQGQPGHHFSIKLIDFDHAYCLFEPEPDAELEPEPPSDIVERWSGDAFMYEDAFSDIVDWPWDEWLHEVYLRPTE